MVSLEKLLFKFKNINDLDLENAYKKTLIKKLGPMAYLNTIFKPVENSIQRNLIDPLDFPKHVRLFYRSYNGAHLFSDLLSIYGFLPTVYQYDRLNKYYPYNILTINKEYFRDPGKSDIILIGSYGYDRSEVYVQKSTGIITCAVRSKLDRIRSTWLSFEEWISTEISRISSYFDEYGNRLVDMEQTLPETQDQ